MIDYLLGFRTYTLHKSGDIVRFGKVDRQMTCNVVRRYNIYSQKLNKYKAKFINFLRKTKRYGNK